MVIVFLIGGYNSPTDGTIMSARRYAEGLRERGHTVRIVSNGVEGPDMYCVKEKYVLFASKQAKKQGQIFIRFDKKVMTRALEGADVVHCFLPWKTSHKVRALAEKLGVPCTAAYHVQPEHITHNIGMSKLKCVTDFVFWRFKRFYDKIGHVHCPSEFSARLLKKRKFRSKMHVISNGVTPNFAPKIKSPEQALVPIEERDFFNILMIGRLSVEKCQDTLIRAANLSKYRDKIRLYFAGKGKNKEKYRKLGQALPNPPVMEFVNQEELLQWIHKADLYVHASDVDNEPLSCIEAFTCGLVPILAESEHSGASLFALTPNSLYPARDAEKLAERIDYWIEHPEERYAYEQKYADAGKSYGLDRSIDLFEEMLAEAKLDFAAALAKKAEKKVCIAAPDFSETPEPVEERLEV